MTNKTITDDEKACKFIKDAFCIDGTVEMCSNNKQQVTSNMFFKCNDSDRGTFWIAYGKFKKEYEQ